MAKSLKKNLTYQTIYQVLTTLTPLITSPYLSRTLGAKGLGIYSFTQSMVNYFLLFAMLGFINYGTRTIALCKNEEEENKSFCEIYTLQIICSIISLSLYILWILLYDYIKLYMVLQSFWIISCLFDVTWYFFGKEEYKTTVIRNIIIKILTICAIILFVKNSSDVGIYILIMSLSTLISQIALWIILLKKIKFKKISINEALKKHFKPVIVLFIPYLAMSIYHIMDKTMLGILSTSEQSGFYYNSDKIVNIPLGILNGLGTVMLSRMSILQKEENSSEKITQLINLSISGITCACVSFSFGIAAISKDFIPFFFGKGYDACINLTMIFAIVILFKSITNIMQSQYMIPFKKERELTICVIIGAIINLISNYILIKVCNLGALGATIGTLIAEMVVMIAQIIVVNKKIKILKSFTNLIAYIVFGIIMFVIIRYISNINVNIVIKLLTEILIGGTVYVTLIYVFLKLTKNELLNIVKIK